MASKKGLNLDMKKIAVIIIIAVIIVGLLGLSLFTENQAPPAQPVCTEEMIAAKDPNCVLPVEQEQVFSYSAKSVEGIVDKILNVGRLGFPVVDIVDLDIDSLNSKLAGVNGIRRVTSSEFKKEEQTGTFYFIADIVLEDDVDVEALTSDVEQTFEVELPIIIRKSIIKIPSSLNLVGTGLAGDLNLSKQFSLNPPFVETFIEADTLPDDDVILDVDVSLKGDKVVSVSAMVLQNLSIQAIHNINIKTKLSELKETLVFSQADYYNGFDPKELASTLEALDDVNSAEFSVTEKGPLTTIFVYKDFNEELLKDQMKESVHALPAVNSINFFKDEGVFQGRMIVDWNRDADLKKLMIDIEQKLLALGLTSEQINVKDPWARISGTIVLSDSVGNKVLTGELENKLNKALFPNVVPETYLQMALLRMDSLIDGKREYFFKEKEIQLIVKAGHMLDEEINLNIEFFAGEDVVIFASGSEEGVKVEN